MLRRKGISLIEVTAALALLATLLAALLIAKQRHARQWSAANRRIEATSAAETLLNSWWPPDPNASIGAPAPLRAGFGTVSPAQSTSIEQNPLASDRTIREEGRLSDDLGWSLTELSDPDALAWGARVVRLEVLDYRVGESDPKVLTTVDLLLPVPEPFEQGMAP